MTWSEYKHSRSGMVAFISRLWGRNLSDRHIMQHDEVLLKLSKRDVIMVGKRFNVDDLLPADVRLNIPPRDSTKKHM